MPIQAKMTHSRCCAPCMSSFIGLRTLEKDIDFPRLSAARRRGLER